MNELLKKMGEILNERSDPTIAADLKEESNEEQLEELISEIEEHLNMAIEAAEMLSRITHGNTKGQLESYFIPWMKKFLDNENQPGSMINIRQMTDDSPDDKFYGER